nr:MAG TPA: hypothetical protein [Caudoviricetes sp.]DAZ76059.1 MAG TPA: hypothetical protein [Caudoviricetes sp.]
MSLASRNERMGPVAIGAGKSAGKNKISFQVREPLSQLPRDRWLALFF